MKSFRRVAAVLTAAAAVAAMSACGTEQAPADPTQLSEQDVTLRMTWWGGDGRHKITQEVIDLFEDKHPTINVEPEFTDWNGYWDKLATSTAGGNAPDVFQMDQLYLASYAERGTLADLGSLSQLDISAMPESVLGMGRSNDTLYGMPISATGFAVLVNTDLLDEYGIEMPDDSSWTWDEYNDWAASITEASGGAVYGSSIGWIEFQLQLFARQLGDNLFSADDIVISEETLASFFQTNLDLVASGAAPSGTDLSERINLPLDQLDFSVGKAATLFSPSTTVTAYQAAVGANVELLELPTVDGAEAGWEYLKPGMYWSVSSKSAHPAEAALLVDFFINDPEAAAVLGVERGIPANPDALDAIRDGLEGPEQKAAAFADGLDLGESPAIVPTGASEIQTVLGRYALEVVLEQKTPQAAAAALIAELEASIASA